MMNLKTRSLPSWLKTAAASLVLLPALPVCAQNAPAVTTPAKPAQAKPALPAPASSPAAAKTAPAATPAQAADRSQAYLHVALASIYEDNAVSQGKPENVNRAIEEYKLALNADPNSPELNNALAALYFRVGRAKEAEVTTRGLLKTSPNDIDAHKLLGRIYLRQLGEGENAGATAASTTNVLELAIAEFEKIIALQPSSVEDRMVLGQLYTVKHDSKKAEEQFKTAQAIEPDSEEVVLNLARLYAESGDLQHAAKVIEDVPVNDRTS
ncbi:MAG TPA: tetratricopeptide repeat protein, partial [Terracidiphilus sp.]|nr:tetratricopeptide repeat protein [Terracidiphilus sp.]